ncbi:hypothetical protein ScPMuIL_011902 [Solemya velum]
MNGCKLIFAILFVVICNVPVRLGARQKKRGLIVNVGDQKEFKKLLRTKTNLLVIFAKSEKAASKLNPLFEDVAEEIKGKATLAFVDCSESKKMCKNLKMSPSLADIRHYKDGEYNKDYDRKMTVKSMVNFLLDPTGDIPWEEEAGAEDVVHITSKQHLAKLLKKDRNPMLLMFYAPWCGFCKKMKPDFAAAATEMKGQAVLAGVDVDKPEQAELRMDYNITGFPTLYYFEDGKMKYKYGGENTKDGLVKWLKNPGPPEEKKAEQEWSDETDDVTFLNDDNIEEFVQEHPSVLIMFYAPWCGHCKKMKPEFQDAAIKLREDGEDGVLAAVDATKSPTIANQLGVKGYPTGSLPSTLNILVDGQFAFDVNERTADKIIEFMKDPKEPPPPPAPEPKWEEIESDVLHLSDDSFKSLLKKKKHTLVMYYAPWCGHCKKAKPEYMQAAAQFKDDTKVAFAAIDCTDHSTLCSSHDVTGYPTFKYFNYGKNPQKYMGGREEADFVNFMNDPLNSGPAPTPPAPNIKEQWAIIEGNENIFFLTESTFETFLNVHKNGALIMFYAPWCGHCKAMKPAYAEAATILKADKVDGALAAVDATVETALATKYSIKSFPSLKYFKDGELVLTYSGARTTEALVKFMKRPLTPPESVPPPPEPSWSSVPSAIKHLAISNFTSYIKDKAAALVMFYAPWCGHCKKAKPVFQAAADQLQKEIGDQDRVFGAVDCTVNREICDTEMVKGYPAFKLYVKGNYLNDYIEERSEESFINFIKNAPTSIEEKHEEL